MARQTTIAYALTAIVEALTTDRTDASRPRALTSSELFREGYPRGIDPTVRSREAAVGKTAFVGLSDFQPEPGITELGSDHLWLVQIAISRDYHIRYEYDVADVRAMMTEVADDTMRIAAALCWPNALSATAAAQDSGLAGAGALKRSGLRTRTSIERVGDGARAARLLNASDLYTALFMFDPDA